MTYYTLAVFGTKAVGKSALIIQFVQGYFITDGDPTIEDLYTHALAIDNENVELDIIDTPSYDDLCALRAQYMRQGKGFIIVYAINDRASFEEVEVFHRDLLERRGTTNVPVVICGNKCDLEDERLVSKWEGEELAQRLNAKFFETSASVNLNVEDAFRTVVREIRKSTASSGKKGGKKGGRKRCVLL